MQDIILEISNNLQIDNEFIIRLIWFSGLKYNIYLNIPLNLKGSQQFCFLSSAH